MCAVSMIGDHYRDKWQDNGWYTRVSVPAVQMPQVVLHAPQIQREEFESLKREVLEMKELLKRAKKYDEDNNEPDCEIDEKMDLLRRVANLVGVELNDVIKSN